MLFSKDKNPKMEEVKQYISVSSSANFDTLQPHLLNAERDYLVPVIGQEMYNGLQAYYNGELSGAGSSTDSAILATLDGLLHLVQAAVLNIAYYIGFDVMNAYITDSGFKRSESDTVKGLFKYQEDRLKRYFRDNGFNGIDAVLAYMETNIARLPVFADCPIRTALREEFIPSTTVYNGIVNINNSRLTFLRLKPLLVLVEHTDIIPLLGAETYAYVKTEMAKESPAVAVSALVEQIRVPLAYLSSALLMEESGADLTDNGLYFASTVALGNSDVQVKPSPADRIAILVMRNRNIGNTFLDSLRSYLTVHAADFPGTTVSTGKVYLRDNTNKKVFWA